MKKMVTIMLLTFSLNVFAAAGIEIQNPIIRLPPPGLKMTAMFFKIINHTDKDLKLLKVSGEFAENFELHTMDMAHGQMKMRAVDSIELKKLSTTELKSGGLHVMIFGLKQPLKDGEVHKVKLTLDNQAEVEVIGKVKKENH